MSNFRVNIRTAHALKGPRYLMIEDYFPAGCEVVEEPMDDEKKKPYTRFETRDERAVFFLTSVPDKEVVFSYKLRAEAPGTFSANPAQGELMYHPHINGHSAISELQINEK